MHHYYPYEALQLSVLLVGSQQGLHVYITAILLNGGEYVENRILLYRKLAQFQYATGLSNGSRPGQAWALPR